MTEKNQKLQNQLKSIPDRPGVYLFKNSRGEVIYVGKSRSLRNRVRSYFQQGQPKDPRKEALVQKITSLEYIVTNNEVEALILEANLIKEKKPYYNVTLRDDKSYPFVRITSEPFPRVFITRRIIQDGSRYFGPYTNVSSLRKTLKIIQKLFPVRSCRYHLTEDSISQGRFQLCLDYHIHRCEGPCIGLVSREEYNHMIEQIQDFLQGKTSNLVTQFKEKMQQAAAELRFEEAARYRDQLQLLQSYTERQSVATASNESYDIIALAQKATRALIILFRIRLGKLIDRERFRLQSPGDTAPSELLYGFLLQYYSRATDLPPEIFLESLPSDLESVTNWLSEKRGGRVRLAQPHRGRKYQLLKLAQENARLELDEEVRRAERWQQKIPTSVANLQEELSLPAPPLRIEGFDISHTAGSYIVASLVVFEGGKPRKSEYRRFRIKKVSGIDDYACMREVVHRRYTRVLRENRKLPDLILIDGGKGQLSAALESLQQLNLTQLPLLGLAKKLELIYLPEEQSPRQLPRTSPALRLLQQVRNEAHRFAIAYHQKLRKKGTLTSLLEEVPGVGPVLQKRLLKRFRSTRAIMNANEEELARIKGVSLQKARQIKEHLQRLLSENEDKNRNYSDVNDSER